MKRKERRSRKNRSLQREALKTNKKKGIDMTGKKVVYVPHPSIPKTMVEKIVDI